MTTSLEFIFPIDDLANAIVQKLKLEIPIHQIDDLKDEVFLTRKEASLKLNISLPTLNAYTKKGILKGYRVGSRVLYRSAEVEEALTEIRYSNF